MPDTTSLLAAATNQQGAGDTLRVLLVVLIVGAVLLGWFLLRGYRGND
jgi:hypothetical protein